MNRNNKFYVATAIIYVNDKPHIGNALDYLTADVLARHAKRQGKEVIFSTGTDEHGAKIAEKAAENGQTPQEFADSNAAKLKVLLEKMNTINNRFVRTTDPGHERRSQIIWEKLKAYIYKEKFEGWYCVGCEEYKTDTVVQETGGKCPDHNRAYDKLTEENYFFKLSSFSLQIKEAIKSQQLRIVPAFRANEILNLVDEGLNDISVSRPKDKISWGIPVPGDDSQVMYVWFEALMNYITILGYPEHPDFERFWPADVQVIGKGILRFHAAIWPAMLIGLGLELPKTLYVHGYATANGQKISKSLGNAIDPVEIIDKYGVDAYRYYFLRHVPSYDDGDFSVERFEAVYNGELANELGNAVSRVASMIARYQDNVIGDVKEMSHDIDTYHQAIDDCRFDRALEIVWEHVSELNKYLELQKPWQVAKTDPEHLKDILAYAAGSLIEIADILWPFMPATARTIRDTFETGILRPLAKPLFPRLDIQTPKVETLRSETSNEQPAS
ncbi:methionine--tRNA ligase [Candidatus Saccharibacteria bacterium]|nr:methionine--tRNA ligase [Candidatus Saccharibacteria bacterium]